MTSKSYISASSALLTAVLCMLFVSVFSYADTKESVPSENSHSSVGMEAEYEKLLEIVKAKRRTVSPATGSLSIENRPGVGRKDANVVLIEFGDFQCPYCRRHLLDTAQNIYSRLVMTNQLRYVFFDFPIETEHPLAVKAAVAARCAEEQGRYWEMRNTLYKSQKAIHEAFLVTHAKTAGLDEIAFSACLDSGRYHAAIQQDQFIGKSLGIRGTPTFFIGINNKNEITLVHRIQGAQPYGVFESAILRAAEKAASIREY